MTECEERTGKLTRRPVADLSHMTTHRGTQSHKVPASICYGQS